MNYSFIFLSLKKFQNKLLYYFGCNIAILLILFINNNYEDVEYV